jgi:hypothetical protein
MGCGERPVSARLKQGTIWGTKASLLVPAAKGDRLAARGSVQDRQTMEVELWPCQYRIKCTAAGCPNLARVIVRRVAEGGTPLGQSELCNKDARLTAAAARADGASVHDMRQQQLPGSMAWASLTR